MRSAPTALIEVGRDRWARRSVRLAVANKAATPRPKDKIDLHELRRIRDETIRDDDKSDRGALT